jgi:hypothetical protein
MESVSCAVKTESLNIVQVTSHLPRLTSTIGFIGNWGLFFTSLLAWLWVNARSVRRKGAVGLDYCINALSNLPLRKTDNYLLSDFSQRVERKVEIVNCYST